MNDRRLLWRRHSTIESFDSSCQHSNAASRDTSPSNTPPITRLFSYPYFDIFEQKQSSGMLNRPRSSTMGEVAIKRQLLYNKRPSQLMQLQRTNFDFRDTTSSNGSSVNSHYSRGRRLSVRQSIFHKVAVSPRLQLNRHSLASINTLFEDVEIERNSICSSKSSPGSPVHDDLNKNAAYYRALWKKVIVFQIESRKNDGRKMSDEFKTKSDMKLIYEEIIGECAKEEQRATWEKMLNDENRSTTKIDRSRLEEAVKAGIPKEMRGKVWPFLIEQFIMEKPKNYDRKEPKDYRYESLTKELSNYQHAILIDLGRTFPSHPYFINPLGAGQMSLLNILKAYSVYDPEVGYCQGLSFVAALILLHMSEESAFSVLVNLLFRYDMRKQYKPDMLALQVKMYQLSRLLSDKHKDLHEHFEMHEIPSLFAAPWFLTLFASAFPLNFVARVFDFVFLTGGLDVVFKIALVLLGNHKELIKQCNSFEAINDFLKLTLPSMSYIQMERIFNQVIDMDISRELLGYEVEYQVLDEEMFSSLGQNDFETVINKLEAENKLLKRQNVELLEKLTQAHSKMSTFEIDQHDLEIKLESSMNTINSYKCKLLNLERCIETLELERKSLLTAVQRIKSRNPLQADSEMFLSCDIPSSTENVTSRLVRYYSNDERPRAKANKLTKRDKK